MANFLKQIFKYFPTWFVFAIWLIHIVSNFFKLNLTWLGTHPRHVKEWYGFLSGALIHSDWQHLINNTYPLLLTGLFLYFLFEKYSNFIFITTYFFTGLFIFLFARSHTYHIGASGLAYAWTFMLAFSGFFRKDKISLGLGLLVAFLYGGMIWGVLPLKPGISWDGHLIGALTGILFAYIYRNINRKEKEDDLAEEEDSPYNFDRYTYDEYDYIRRQHKDDSLPSS